MSNLSNENTSTNDSQKNLSVDEDASDNHQQEIGQSHKPLDQNSDEQSSTLSALGLDSELYFSMSYQSTRINQKGLLAKIKKQKEELDIDIACALYDDKNVLLELVWYKKLRDSSEAIRHHGDELRGTKIQDSTKNTQPEDTQTEDTKNEENNTDASTSEPQEAKKKKYHYQVPNKSELETIHLVLGDVPQTVCHIALLVSSFQNVPLNTVNAGAVELEDIEGNTALYSDFSNVPAGCASFWVASLDRNNDTSAWTLLNKNMVLPHHSMDGLSKKLFVQNTEN